uniref:BPTI/Kunitz inhibitor domain-containing protein n=1 Tax=Echinococcus canadensis TaxID=519352 RepID=A0A915EW94_9CEST
MYVLVAFFTTVAVFSFSKAQSDPCRMPIEPGLCLAYFPSWGYEQSTGQCVKFIYGGCQGNLNRFDSKEECEATCIVSNRCNQPIVQGRCRAYIPSWGYDMVSGRCKRFIYGGCHGNQNRFRSKEECQMASILSTAQQARLPEMLAKEAFGYYELLNELFHAKVAALLLTAQVITATAVVLPWRR